MSVGVSARGGVRSRRTRSRFILQRSSGKTQPRSGPGQARGSSRAGRTGQDSCSARGPRRARERAPVTCRTARSAACQAGRRLTERARGDAAPAEGTCPVWPRPRARGQAVGTGQTETSPSWPPSTRALRGLRTQRQREERGSLGSRCGRRAERPSRGAPELGGLTHTAPHCDLRTDQLVLQARSG